MKTERWMFTPKLTKIFNDGWNDVRRNHYQPPVEVGLKKIYDMGWDFVDDSDFKYIEDDEIDYNNL